MKHTELDDRALVAKARDGDARAFDVLMERLEPDLASFLRGRLRGVPDVELSDVMQELRLYLFQRLDRYNPEYPIEVFTRGLAKNVAKRFVYGKRDLLPAGFGGETEERDATDLSPIELEELPLSFREVMGLGRFGRPDGPPPPSRVFLELLEVFFRWGGYPHQQICFAYSILLWGREKKRTKAADEGPAGRDSGKVPVTGDPDRVVREVSPRELSPAADEMLEELGETAKLDPDYLARVRRPLDRRLALTGEELFVRDVASAERFAALAARIVGRNRLEEYYGSDPRKSVSEWTHAVKNRVRRAFTDPESTKRIPLPEISDEPRKV